jgi:hypothetical protein
VPGAALEDTLAVLGAVLGAAGELIVLVDGFVDGLAPGGFEPPEPEPHPATAARAAAAQASVAMRRLFVGVCDTVFPVCWAVIMVSFHQGGLAACDGIAADAGIMGLFRPCSPRI